MRQLYLPLLLALAAQPAVALDKTEVATIAPIVVVRLATARYDMIAWLDDDKKLAMRREIDALDPKVATVVWLALLEHAVSVSSVDGRHVPAKFVQPPYFLARMHEALEAAGMSREAARFAEATAGRERRVAPGKPAEITEADANGIELGDAFGTREDLDAGLLAFVDASPTTSAWLARARTDLTQADRAQALFEMLVRRPDAFPATAQASWPQPYRIFWLAEIYLGELYNGGMEQFFANPSGDEVPQTADAMRTLGLPQQADVIRQAMGYFPIRYPTDRAERLAVEQAVPGLSDRLDALTPRADNRAIAAALLAYVEREGILPR